LRHGSLFSRLEHGRATTKQNGQSARGNLAVAAKIQFF
jgi:hypothetical protein